MSNAPWTSDQIRALCLEHGFARAGVAPAQRSPRAEVLEDWIAAGRHGTMGWMAEHVDVRSDARRLLDGAKSVICVLDRYADGATNANPGGAGWRYARGRDYHVVMKKRLHAVCDRLAERAPDHQFRACVDTLPLLEREIAARAGLGGIGKHTLLIEPGLGSWLLIGSIVTTLELEETGGVEDYDPCGACTRCIDACPTDAITPWSVDARACISALTIEHRGADRRGPPRGDGGLDLRMRRLPGGVSPQPAHATHRRGPPPRVADAPVVVEGGGGRTVRPFG